MKSFLNGLRHLDRRLIAIICLSIIPINILAILLSSITLRESRARIELYYSSEFNAVLQETTECAHALNVWRENFLSDHLSTLSYPGEFNSVMSISMINQTGSAMPESELHGFFFLQEHGGEQRLLIKNSGGDIVLRKLDEIREELKEIVSNAEKPVSIAWVGGKPYYLFFQEFKNYSFGLLLDLSRLAERVQNNTVLSGSEFLLSDGKQTLLFSADEEARLLSAEETAQQMKRRHILGRLGIEGLTLEVILIRNQEYSMAVPGYIALQVLAFSSVLVIVLLWGFIRREVIMPIRHLQKGIEDLEENGTSRLPVFAGTEDFSYLFSSFNKMSEDIQRSHEKDLLLLRSELDNLKLQVNPHMLLNSLNMIYSMAETGQSELIQRFTMSLSAYFRYSLKETSSLVPLTSELEFVKNYLELQKMRYPDELSGNYYISEGLEKALIPPLLIQNFVENATKYSRIPQKIIEILIWIRKEDEQLAITVQDTGKGIDSDLLVKLNKGEVIVDAAGIRHIGIWNCRRRLFAFFGENAKLWLSSEKGTGSCVEIRMPLIMEKDYEFVDR